VEHARVDITLTRPPLQFRWAAAISAREWSQYRAAIEAVRRAGIPFMLGGGFALAAYTGRWRDTKDIDFYIRPGDRDAAVAALSGAGFGDYFATRPYDRNWIFRSVSSDVIVDLIWSMANQRAQVDDSWFEFAGQLSIRNEPLLILPPEEFIWCKLYIFQRDHCDWTDIFNVLYTDGEIVNWARLIARLQEHTPLLAAMLMVYGWLCPQRALRLPRSLFQELQIPLPVEAGVRSERERVRLLDSRCWFAALLPIGEKLEI
jgi:hypothetical protein